MALHGKCGVNIHFFIKRDCGQPLVLQRAYMAKKKWSYEAPALSRGCWPVRRRAPLGSRTLALEIQQAQCPLLLTLVWAPPWSELSRLPVLWQGLPCQDAQWQVGGGEEPRAAWSPPWGFTSRLHHSAQLWASLPHLWKRTASGCFVSLWWERSETASGKPQSGDCARWPMNRCEQFTVRLEMTEDAYLVHTRFFLELAG